MMILVAVLTLVSLLLFASLVYAVSEFGGKIVDAYTDGRADQIELEQILELVDRDDPALFAREVEQLVAEQLVERFGHIVSATIVELDGSERQVSEWDLEDRLEFYRQLRAGH